MRRTDRCQRCSPHCDTQNGPSRSCARNNLYLQAYGPLAPIAQAIYAHLYTSGGPRLLKTSHFSRMCHRGSVRRHMSSSHSLSYLQNRQRGLFLSLEGSLGRSPRAISLATVHHLPSSLALSLNVGQC